MKWEAHCYTLQLRCDWKCHITSMYDVPAAIMYVGMAKLKIEESATRKQV